MPNTYLLFVCIAVASLVIETYAAGGSCYAPPMQWGPECRSSTSIFGAKIRYDVTVHGNGGTVVCCKGYSPAYNQLLDIGCGHKTFAEYGEDTTTAAIKLSPWLIKIALLTDLLFILVSKI